MSNTNKNEFQIEDCGLQVCMTSLPFGKENLFVDKVLKKLFAEYKGRLNKHSTSSKANSQQLEFEENFYKPIPYLLFGEFSLATISLIEDFTLSSRIFHPHSSYLNKRAVQESEEAGQYTFDYKIISGISRRRSGSQGLVSKSKKSFLSKHRLPFLSITSLKVSNALLIGSGSKMITQIILLIESIVGRLHKGENKIQFHIIESFGWNELSIVFFSSKYDLIIEAIQGLRESTVHSLIEIEGGNSQEADDIIDSCILNRQSDHKKDIRGNHLFVNTHSTFGYDYELFRNAHKGGASGFEGISNIKLATKWDIKPGHTRDAVIALDQLSSRNLVVGSSTIVSPSYSLKDISILWDIMQKPDLLKIVKNLTTELSIEYDFGLLDNTQESNHFYQSIEALCYSSERLIELQKDLSSCKISKILRERVINVYVNFNYGIKDPNLYGYFYELRPFLDLLQDSITAYKDDKSMSIDRIQIILDSCIEHFEKAFRNRFQQSYLFQNITDFTMEFNGAIQQLVSAVNIVYKAYTTAINGDDASFAYITGYPGIDSTQVSLRLNYFHAFQPELFLAVVCHEASNYFLQKGEAFNKVLSGDYIVSKDEKSELDKIIKLVSFLRNDDPEYLTPLKEALRPNLSIGQSLYLNLFKPRLFQWVLGDLFALILTYNQNSKLFWYWNWHYFLQIPSNYDRKGNLIQSNCVQFMIRLLIPLYHLNGHLDDFKKPPVPQLDKLWNRHFDNIKEVLTSAFNMKSKEVSFNLRDWVSIVWNMGLIQDAKSFYVENEGELDFKRLQQEKKEFFDRESLKNKKQLEKGTLISYRQEYGELLTEESYIRLLSFSYLDLMAEKNEFTNCICPRSAEKSKPQLDSYDGRLSEFLSDPTGGIFTHNQDTRRSYFKLRSTLLKSLVDLSQTQNMKDFEFSVESRD